ncbi:hypothetical protein ANN_06820 [Periplaneta americana]|uniref:Endonuclease/exonuclease/phosphatase domain-containing protein n=1 Tax=Periplaneta americana TaxID=6978 RepID=A0ABQ8TGA8_PERAM|nr:hypothetical protein ANN_06820 [Periplaneta americana]
MDNSNVQIRQTTKSRGRNKVRIEDLRAAEKRAWLYVGRLRPETTGETIKRFLKREIKDYVTCEELTTKYDTKSFKVGIPFHKLEETKTEGFWPEGMSSEVHTSKQHTEKKKTERGVSILTRPEHTPIKATRLLEHTILTEIKTCTAYFQPNKTAINIMDEIGQMITQSNQNKPIIIAGDLNCRLDIQTHKSKIIIEKLQEGGLTLLSDPMEPAYFSHNGKSTIDIALIRGTIRGSITPSWTTSHAPIRKHIPIEINIKVEWSVTRRKETEKTSLTRHQC